MMNERIDKHEATGPEWEASQIDRLVDGDLSADEYRQLLNVLDTSADGWRRCALAFLEAQAWASELKQLLPPSIRSSSVQTEASLSKLHTTTVTGEGAPRTTTSDKRVSLRDAQKHFPFLSLATGAIVLVAIGYLMGFSVHAPKSSPPVVGGSANQYAGNDGWSKNRVAVTQPNAVTDGSSRDKNSLAAHDLVADTDVQQPLLLPVVPLDDEHALRMLSEPYLPRHVRRSLERSGYSVSENRQLTPVQLGDGRPAWLPIDEVTITPVSRRPF